MYYEKFEYLCKLNGVNASKVSKATGISTATLSSWKNGKYTPKNAKLQLIADYFGVPLAYLLSENPDTDDAPVQKNEQAGYYTNPETAKKAQELYDDPKYRVLFDAAEGSDPDDLQMAADLLLRLKQTRRD
ncbi:MAG: helix-turn-helix transcriptional regulator [Lachnospiraceae bacterium]|nr:helix-turn-helix transcriptional regulator [Lachnospiraceae bacterium]